MIKMRTRCDCQVACLAMLLGWTYEEVADFFPPKAIRETGYRWKWIIPYMNEHLDLEFQWFDCQNIFPDWSKPAVVTVPSLTLPERGDHVIFWNEEKVIDPSNIEPKYKELPKNKWDAYQIKGVN